MLWPLKTNLVGKFPCLLTLLHTNLECYLFCKSLHILCVRDQFVKGRISLLKQCVIFFLKSLSLQEAKRKYHYRPFKN